MKFLRVLAVFLLLPGISLAKEVTTLIKALGMTCGACAVSVQRSLERTKGVKRVDVRLEKGLVTVTYDDAQVNEQQLREVIRKTGFATEPAK